MSQLANAVYIVNKTIATHCIIVEELGARLGDWLDKYLVTLFDHVDNIHSEVCSGENLSLVKC